jgi:hypothetical protein
MDKKCCQNCDYWMYVETTEQQERWMLEGLHCSKLEVANRKNYGKCLRTIFYEEVDFNVDPKELPPMMSHDASGYHAFLTTHKDHCCSSWKEKCSK